ncbi:hypothetical protein AAC387_Pa04g1136 [Persea americana]
MPTKFPKCSRLNPISLHKDKSGPCPRRNESEDRFPRLPTMFLSHRSYNHQMSWRENFPAEIRLEDGGRNRNGSKPNSADLSTALGKRDSADPSTSFVLVARVQSLSGMGSIRLASSFIQRYFPDTQAMISSPTWVSHKNIFDDVGVPWSEYRYYEPKTVSLDFDGMISDIKAAPDGSFIVLHGCAHSPTGIDPTPQQWEKIADVIQEKNHIPFFDVSYQGLASGNLDIDACQEKLKISEVWWLLIKMIFYSGLRSVYSSNLTGGPTLSIRDGTGPPPWRADVPVGHNPGHLHCKNDQLWNREDQAIGMETVPWPSCSPCTAYDSRRIPTS